MRFEIFTAVILRVYTPWNVWCINKSFWGTWPKRRLVLPLSHGV